MKVPYICNCYDDCNKYYINQAGNGLPYYRGIRIQKGKGFFSNIMRMAIPFFKKGLIHLGKHSINTASNIIDDLESGENFKNSIKKRGVETANNIGNEIINKVTSALNQQGRGKKRKMKIKKNIKNKKIKTRKNKKIKNKRLTKKRRSSKNKKNKNKKNKNKNKRSNKIKKTNKLRLKLRKKRSNLIAKKHKDYDDIFS